MLMTSQTSSARSHGEKKKKKKRRAQECDNDVDDVGQVFNCKAKQDQTSARLKIVGIGHDDDDVGRWKTQQIKWVVKIKILLYPQKSGMIIITLSNWPKTFCDLFINGNGSTGKRRA